jgi:hypothetical protein
MNILAGEIADRESLAAQYDDSGRPEEAARLRTDATFLESVLKDV